MTDINRYKVYCNTESQDVYIWSVSTPTVCPNNNTHSINTNTITIIQGVSNRKVEIQEEDPDVLEPTSGRFRSQGFQIKSTSQEEHLEFSWCYPVSALNIKFTSSSRHVGDIVDCNITPAEFLAYTDSSEIIGATSFKVDAVNIANININDDIYVMYPEDSYTQCLGKVTAKDTNTNIVTFNIPLQRVVEKNYYVSRRKKVGYLTANKQVGDVLINLNPELIPLLQRGLYLTVSDNTNIQELGEIYEINTQTNQVRIQNPLQYNFNMYSYIYVTVKTLKNYKISSEQQYIIGNSKIGGSYITKFYMVSIKYVRPQNLIDYPPINFNWSVEYMY